MDKRRPNYNAKEGTRRYSGKLVNQCLECGKNIKEHDQDFCDKRCKIKWEKKPLPQGLRVFINPKLFIEAKKKEDVPRILEKYKHLIEPRP